MTCKFKMAENPAWIKQKTGRFAIACKPSGFLI